MINDNYQTTKAQEIQKFAVTSILGGWVVKMSCDFSVTL